MSISKRLDALPMTPTLTKVVLLAGVGWLFDAMDQGMVSGVIASIGTDWQLDQMLLGMLTSSGILGMIFGAALSGIAADRWGRRSVIVFTLILFSLGSAASGLAINYPMLLICRFITGFGLGGELPAASTLVSEFSSLRNRGRNVVILESFWAWGWIAAACVAYFAIPIFGWRIAFFIGAVPAVFAAILRLAIPESPRYLETHGQHAQANKLVSRMEREAGITTDPSPSKLEGTPIETKPIPSFLALFKKLWSKENLRATLVLWIIWFGVNFGYYGFVMWTPSLLMERGFDMVRSFQFTLYMCLTQLPGYLVAALLIEKLGRKPVITSFLIGTAMAAWLFGQSSTEFMVLLSGCLLYFFALGTWGCVYSYTPELYPTDVRGSGTGWAASFGRVGALVAPILVPAMYRIFGATNGFTYVFMTLTAVFVIVAIIVGVFGKETKGNPLKDS
jgi:putative MFS transporter